MMRNKFILWLVLLCITAIRTPDAAHAADDRLRCLHTDERTLNHAVQNARDYGEIASDAGVVPHHLTAAVMIAGFFSALRDSHAEYDTFIIIGPNHTGEGGEITVSLRDWDYGGGVLCDKELINALRGIEFSNAQTVVKDARMEDDHALSALIPFIHHYFPDACVAPVLLNRSLSYDDALIFADALAEIIADSGKRVFLLCSIDFSHYKTPEESALRDAETISAVLHFDYRAVYAYNDAHTDCRAALITFMKYADLRGVTPQVVDRSDASTFAGPGVNETTSYLIFADSR